MTRGGEFLPGHDSKFVSVLTAAVADGSMAEAEAKAQLPSAKLVDQFERWLPGKLIARRV